MVISIMRCHFLLSLLWLPLTFAAYFKGVLVLDDNTFSSQINNEFTFVNFYSKTCQYCHKVGPVIELLANVYNGTKITVALLEGKENKATRKQEKIIGFPTMRLYSHGEHVASFNGHRNLDSMIDFITSHTGVPPNQVDSSVLTVEGDQEISKGSVIAFTAPWMEDWNQKLTKFDKLAKGNPDLKFYKIDSSIAENAEIVSQFQVSKYPTLIYYGADGSIRRLERNVESRMDEFVNSDIDDEPNQEEPKPRFKPSYGNYGDKEIDEEEAFKKLREL